MPFNANTHKELEEKVFVPLGPCLNPFRPFTGPLVILLGAWLGPFSPSFVGGPAWTTTMILMSSNILSRVTTLTFQICSVVSRQLFLKPLKP
jgi:hypothetical protein